MKSYIDSLLKRSARRRNLIDLQKLPEHLLRDIGLTSTDVALMIRGDIR
jgi:uncharacterized protein YjiS (DUF1127 family)